MKWPPPKKEYLKSLFHLSLANKKAEIERENYIHRRARGKFPLCEQRVPLEKQSLQDDEVTCPVCLNMLKHL